MEKKRVNKGEKYWYILCDSDGIDVEDWEEHNLFSDRILYNAGNYFRTKEEAEAMAEKIRKVLKGADVIVMPSKEECEEYSDRAIYTPDDTNRGVHAYEVVAYAKGIENGVEWLKSKIIK